MPTHNPRVNVVVTEEQHALLLELARLDPTVRSAAAFLRAMLDQATPLLRKTVPMMRAAAEETDQARSQLRGLMGEFMAEMDQLDLLDARKGRTERSEGAPLRARK